MQVDAVELNTGGKPLRMKLDKPLGNFGTLCCQIGKTNMWTSLTMFLVFSVVCYVIFIEMVVVKLKVVEGYPNS